MNTKESVCSHDLWYIMATSSAAEEKKVKVKLK